MITTPTFSLTLILAAAIVAPGAAQPIGPGPIGPGPMGLGPLGPGPGAFAMRLGPHGPDTEDRADDLYESARDAIEEGKYDRALDRFGRLIELKSKWTDAAMYWKAYSLTKLGRRADALSTLSDLQQQF